MGSFDSEEAKAEINEHLETQRLCGYWPVMVRFPGESGFCRSCGKKGTGNFGVGTLGERVEKPEKCYVWTIVSTCGECHEDERKMKALIEKMLQLPRPPVQRVPPDPDRVPAAPSGRQVLGYAEMAVRVWYVGDPLDPKAEAVIESVPHVPFPYWMVGCEHFIRAAAQKSALGYEEAIDSLVRGALVSKGKFEQQE